MSVWPVNSVNPVRLNRLNGLNELNGLNDFPTYAVELELPVFFNSSRAWLIDLKSPNPFIIL